MRLLLIFIFCLLSCTSAFAQQAKKDTVILLSSEPLLKIDYDKLEAEKKKAEANKPKTFSWLQTKYAKKMKVSPEDIDNLALYNFVEDWYGTRYVYGGTTKRGIDCSAFVQKMTNCVLGTKVVRTAASQRHSTRHIKRDELKEGDLVFFKIKVKRISHVGVYLQNGYFVHASSSRGVMISSLNSSYWSRYYAGGGRFSFMEEEMTQDSADSNVQEVKE